MDMSKMDKVVSLCKRRGFIFQSSEIYGGLNGFWDYGPLGVELKRNIKEAWWRDMVTSHDDLTTLPGAPSSSPCSVPCCALRPPRARSRRRAATIRSAPSCWGRKRFRR